jgi:pimeloyl-ACP methyl ester carboxylesterase
LKKAVLKNGVSNPNYPMTQDPLLVDRLLEGGGPYQVDDADLDVYCRPFLTSFGAGRALLAVLQNLRLKQTVQEITEGLAQRPKPTLVAWGTSDPWLPVSAAKAAAQTIADCEFVEMDETGHYAQEDWPEKVSEALIPFLRRMAT